MEERRLRERYELRYPAKIETSQEIFDGETINLSVEGAFIYCQEPLAIKETATLIINFPDGFIMDTLAEVVWSTASESDDDTGPPGMGVRFLW